MDTIDLPAQAGSTIKPKSWRDVLPVHPAADMFPPMERDELLALGQDIKKNGLKQWIVTWTEDFDGRNVYLLDGRNRLDAMEAVGIEFEIYKGGTVRGQPKGLRAYHLHGKDPVATAMSYNLHRRHLTAEQKRDIIGRLLQEDPSKSNRSIGAIIKADHKTVGTVRAELESRGEIPHVETRKALQGSSAASQKSEGGQGRGPRR